MNDQQLPAQPPIKNVTVAAIAGQAGCVTLTIVLSALFIGLWLDSLLPGEGRPITFILLLISVPLSLYLMLRVTLWAISRLGLTTDAQDSDPPDTNEE